MNRQALIDALVKAGFDAALLPDVVPLATLAEMARLVAGLEERCRQLQARTAEDKRAAADALADEVAKVEEYYRQNWPDMERAGLKKEGLIGAFKAYREMHPNCTAADFLGR